MDFICLELSCLMYSVLIDLAVALMMPTESGLYSLIAVCLLKISQPLFNFHLMHPDILLTEVSPAHRGSCLWPIYAGSSAHLQSVTSCVFMHCQRTKWKADVPFHIWLLFWWPLPIWRPGMLLHWRFLSRYTEIGHPHLSPPLLYAN